MSASTILAIATIVLFIVWVALGLYLRYTTGKPSLHMSGNSAGWASAPCIKPDHACVTTPTGERLHINYNEQPLDSFQLHNSSVINRNTYRVYETPHVERTDADNLFIDKPKGATLRSLSFSTDWNDRAYVTLTFGVGSRIAPRDTLRVRVYLTPAPPADEAAA